MKKTITFDQLKKLVKEASGASTYKTTDKFCSYEGCEFESEELYDIYPTDDDLGELFFDLNPTKCGYLSDGEDIDGVITASFLQEQYNTLIEMAKLLGGSDNEGLKKVSNNIMKWVKPWQDKLNNYIDNQPENQKKKRREQYLKLRDEFKDEEI